MQVTEAMIGTKKADGSVEWPTLGLDGRRFDRASGGFSVRPIGGGRFVVIPSGIPANVDLELTDAVPSLDAAFRLMFPEPLGEDDDDE